LSDLTTRSIPPIPQSIPPIPQSITQLPNYPITRFIASLAIAAAVLAGGACRSQPKPAPRQIVIWRSIGSWSGQGNTQTGSFTNDSGAMRVRWETRKESSPGKGTFRLSLHSAISGRPLLVAVDQRGVGHDLAEFAEDPRVSYLVVESANIDWAFTLEEALGATVEPSRK
jgi:hypothetical protein